MMMIMIMMIMMFYSLFRQMAPRLAFFLRFSQQLPTVARSCVQNKLASISKRAECDHLV